MLSKCLRKQCSSSQWYLFSFFRVFLCSFPLKVCPEKPNNMFLLDIIKDTMVHIRYAFETFLDLMEIMVIF